MVQLLAFNQTQIQCYPEDHQQALPASADSIPNSFAAGVAELADALDLGSSGLKPVQVRFLSPALNDLSLK